MDEICQTKEKLNEKILERIVESKLKRAANPRDIEARAVSRYLIWPASECRNLRFMRSVPCAGYFCHHSN